MSGDQADDSIKEEKMEVEGLSSGGGDADSCTKAGKCRPNLQESLKKMAAETDFLGFTPLLRACQVYRMYQVPRNLKPAQVEQQQENGRQFIRALIEVAGSDVNATVQAKNIPDAKIPQYTSEGGCHVQCWGRLWHLHEFLFTTEPVFFWCFWVVK